MKKTLLILAALSLVCAACLVGCGKKQETNEKSEGSEPAESEPEIEDSYVSEEPEIDESEIYDSEETSETVGKIEFPEDHEYDELIIGRWDMEYEDRVASLCFEPTGTGTIGMSSVTFPLRWCTKDGQLYLELTVANITETSCGPYEIEGGHLAIIGDNGEKMVFINPDYVESDTISSEETSEIDEISPEISAAA